MTVSDPNAGAPLHASRQAGQHEEQSAACLPGDGIGEGDGLGRVREDAMPSACWNSETGEMMPSPPQPVSQRAIAEAQVQQWFQHRRQRSGGNGM
jgi:hypothetical protein